MTTTARRVLIGRGLMFAVFAFVFWLIVAGITIYPDYGPVVGTWWLLGLWGGSLVLTGIYLLGKWLAGEHLI
jgi:hypothetical protein